MTDEGARHLSALGCWLRAHAPLALAVSGGVDSMTLAFVAHHEIGGDAVMFHADSPAVPAAAGARVRDYAGRLGWDLRIVSAGEFDDEDYRGNPVDRCFYCKTNLYSTLADHSGGAVNAIPAFGATDAGTTPSTTRTVAFGYELRPDTVPAFRTGFRRGRASPGRRFVPARRADVRR